MGNKGEKTPFGSEADILADIKAKIELNEKAVTDASIDRKLLYGSRWWNEPKAQVAIRETVKYFGRWLFDPRINEICYNGVVGETNKVYCEDYKSDWHSYDVDWSFTSMESYCSNLVVFNGLGNFDNNNPVASVILPGGERGQVVTNPVTSDGRVSITIRKPSSYRYRIKDYINSGIIDEDLAKFVEFSVKRGKNIVICGETGSGKTTFMKTLIDFIPLEDRIITIEDVAEIRFYEHKNVVPLFYPSEAKHDSKINSAVLLKSCLRMKPDRILLAEVRGGETYDFLNVVSSGHNGSMTSCHAGSVASCIDRLVMMSMQNDIARSLGKDMIRDTVAKTVNMIIVLKKVDKRRMVTEYMDEGIVYKNNGFGVFEKVGSINE